MTPFQAAVVAEARAWIGTPYVHQASVRGAGADCLGLVRGVWRAMVGAEPVAVPPYTPDWGEGPGREVLMGVACDWLRPAVAPAPGDVILFRMRAGSVAKHLGIATGPDRFVHAYTGHGVVENALGGPWARRVAGRFAFPQGD